MNAPDLKKDFSQGNIIEYPTFYTFNEKSRSSVVITVEHAGNAWPDTEPLSEMPENWQNDHYSFDQGARELALKLAAKLNCPVVLGKYSRVLVDLNRIVGAEDIVRMDNDGVEFGMNYIKDEEKKIVPTELADHRIAAYYVPYHQKVRELLARGGNERKHLSIHSYAAQKHTNDYFNEWLLGVQYPTMNGMVQSALNFFGKLDDVCVGDNKPYNLREGLPGAISLHAASFGIETVELEFRDDQLTNPELEKFWFEKTLEWTKSYGLDRRLSAKTTKPEQPSVPTPNNS